MNATYTVTIENPLTLTEADYQTVVAAQGTTFTSLDHAEQHLRAAFPTGFVYRGGHHVALHEGSGHPRVLLVEEHDAVVAPPTPRSRTFAFSAFTAEVTPARADARREAREHGRGLYVERGGRRIPQPCAFVRSRGTCVYTLGDTVGRVAPYADEPAAYGGTKRELVALVSDILAHHPACNEVIVSGGFDLSETIDFDDYEPEVTTWEVRVWTRADGYASRFRPRVRRCW